MVPISTRRPSDQRLQPERTKCGDGREACCLGIWRVGRTMSNNDQTRPLCFVRTRKTSLGPEHRPQRTFNESIASALAKRRAQSPRGHRDLAGPKWPPAVNPVHIATARAANPMAAGGPAWVKTRAEMKRATGVTSGLECRSTSPADIAVRSHIPTATHPRPAIRSWAYKYSPASRAPPPVRIPVARSRDAVQGL
jgi:hypothetical protein